MLLYKSLLNCFLALLMLLFNWKVNRNVVFLASTVLLIYLYTITYYFIAIDPSRFWAALFYANLAPLWYLAGPCLFLYVRGNLEDEIRFRKSDLLHLLPFAISLVGIFPYLLTPFQHKLETVNALFLDPNIPRLDPPNWLLPVEWNLLLRPGLLITYAAFCIGWVLHAQGRFSKTSTIPRDQWVFLRNWMILLSGIIIVISVPPLLLSYYYSSEYPNDFKRINAYAMTSATAYVQTLISLTLLIYPQILYGIPRSSKAGMTLKEHDPALPEEVTPGNRQVASTLGDDAPEAKEEPDPFQELSRRVTRHMEEQRPYVDPHFTLEVLARSMDVPKHHLYYCLQNILKTKFTRLRTEYRIRHAKMLPAEADLTRTMINVIGKESGFASVSAFYTTFKSEVECSPGEFAARVNPTFPK